jgi:fermentation-respiration switch protein FrsA (DUF1100 family)
MISSFHFKQIILTLGVLSALLSGCLGVFPNNGKPPAVTLTEVDTATLQISSPTLTATAALALPSLTLTRAVAPSITPSPTMPPTATPTPDPMSIAAMRARSYPGSDIVIDSELPPVGNYHRYYAYYLSDGLKIYGLLTVPNGTMPDGGWPAIVFNHGYIQPAQYRTTERYVAYVDSLASHGYVVYKIDYRGHDRSEGVAAGAYGDPGYEDDVLNALASLERFPQVNPQKIGMWGHSMGGFLTLRAMVISKDIKVGVIWSGVVGSYADMLCCWHVHSGPTPTPPPESLSHGGWHGWIQQYGTPAENPQFWDSISATSFLGDLSGPLQLHHDLNDSEVPYAFSKTLADEVQAAGKIVELYSYPGDDHNLAAPFSQAMSRTIQFFDQYLK